MDNIEQITKAELPTVEELPRYTKDTAPTSIEELKCLYKEDDRTPLVLPDSLIGYCVPPEGIVSVWVNGVGARAGRGPMMYAPGTFREDRHTIGKELGAETDDMLALRESSKVKKIADGIRQSFEEHGVIIDGRENADILGAVAKVVMDKVFDDTSSREAIKLLGMMDKMFFGGESKEKQAGKVIDLAKESMDVVKDVLKWTEAQRGEIINAEFIPPPED